jgi:hypothetical protein
MEARPGNGVAKRTEAVKEPLNKLVVKCFIGADCPCEVPAMDSEFTHTQDTQVGSRHLPGLRVVHSRRHRSRRFERFSDPQKA